MRASGTWLSLSDNGPIAQLSFSYENGSRGSIAEYRGAPVLVLIVSLVCPVCRAAIVGVGAAANSSHMPLLILRDRGVPPAVGQSGDEQPSPPVAFAPLPEIYLGLGIPRGTWIKYPSLAVLDGCGRVRAFSNVASEIADPRWVATAVASGGAGKGGGGAS